MDRSNRTTTAIDHCVWPGATPGPALPAASVGPQAPSGSLVLTGNPFVTDTTRSAASTATKDAVRVIVPVSCSPIPLDAHKPGAVIARGSFLPDTAVHFSASILSVATGYLVNGTLVWRR